MGATYKQTNRTLVVKTPLGTDTMLLVGFTGREGISQLFHYTLDLRVEHSQKGTTPIPEAIDFDKLLGQSITVEITLADGAKRYFNGICNALSQGEMDEEFTSYQMELVPAVWLLTRTVQCRIFQPPESAVPDILKAVLGSITTEYKIQGTFEPRDYCVQYRESDFAFASRLMEEEGIYYYFKHDDGSHTLVVGDRPDGHADVPGPKEILYEESVGGVREDDRILHWSKRQEIRSGKYTLWDHSFEKPDSNFEATTQILESVAVGQETHKLKVANNDAHEIYDYPGAYAQRFDGVDKSGGDQSSAISKIFDDNTRTVAIRMQQEAMQSLVIEGESNCRHLVTGHTFTLAKHVNANGDYVLTSMEHSAHEGLGGEGDNGFSYTNRFTCIPSALPFLPQRTVPKPVIAGTQTAVVVGMQNDEIFTDKYGRVKVQFRWDRQGKMDAASSCWIRVASIWAGQQWGAIHIPRVGQEVVVAFEEGDPDTPIIVGSVYNAEQMPPYTLPDNKTQSGLKTRSTLKGDAKTFNELRIEDKKGSEEIYFHAEKDFRRFVENDDELTVEHDQTNTIKNDQTTTVEHDQKSTIKNDQTITVEHDQSNTIKNDQTTKVENNQTNTITNDRTTTVESGNDGLTIKTGNQTIKLNVGKSSTQAGQAIELKVGSNSIKIDQSGVTIKGLNIKVEGSIQTEVKGLMTKVEGSAMTEVKGGLVQIN